MYILSKLIQSNGLNIDNYKHLTHGLQYKLSVVLTKIITETEKPILYLCLQRVKPVSMAPGVNKRVSVPTTATVIT